MKNNLLFVFFIALSITAFSQTPIQKNSSVGLIFKRVGSDSMFYLPLRCDTLMNAYEKSLVRTGSVFWDTCINKRRIFYNNKWNIDSTGGGEVGIAGNFIGKSGSTYYWPGPIVADGYAKGAASGVPAYGLWFDSLYYFRVVTGPMEMYMQPEASNDFKVGPKTDINYDSSLHWEMNKGSLSNRKITVTGLDSILVKGDPLTTTIDTARYKALLIDIISGRLKAYPYAPGSGSGTANLDTARDANSVTILAPGTDARIGLVDIGSNKAGVVSPNDKRGIDSAFTKRETTLYYGNRYINTYYNHKGEVVWKDTTAKDLNVSLPLFAPNDSTIAAKNDSAAWNAKALMGINIHTTGPADGQVPKYVAAQNRIEWLDDNAGSGSVSDSGVTKAYKYRPGTISTTGNNRFIKIAAGVFRPDVSGGIGSTTTWSFIQNGGHTSIFFDSVVSINNTNSIRVYFPTVKNLLSVVMNPDETLSGYPIDLGATIAVGYAEFLWYRNIIYAGTLTGNGSSWSATSSLEGFSMDYNTSTGLTRFSLPASIQGVDYERFTVTYNGDSTRFIKRQASGIGAYNYGFYLRDLYGNNVTGNLGAGEKVVINSSTIYRQAFVTSPVSAGNQTILSAQSNVWIEGVFEVYLAATPVNATSNYVEWQAYPSATSYKIYRSTNANFSGETLIYSGAGFSHQDTGLTTNTLYYYRMVAVVSGVDTEVTRSEKCRTL